MGVACGALFSGAQDISDTWGKLHFGVTPVRVIRECEPTPFAVVGCFPLPDGTWEVFGQQLTEIGRGKESFQETNAWKLIRATTRDGVQFENQTTVLDQPPGPWTDHIGLADNPDAKEYRLRKFKLDDSGSISAARTFTLSSPERTCETSFSGNHRPITHVIGGGDGCR